MLSNIERDEKTGLPMGSAVVVANKAGQILAVNRPGEPEKLCLPGGKMEKGESRAENAVRELFEETGVSARESDLKELFFGLCEGGGSGLFAVSTGGTIGAEPYADPKNPPKSCSMPEGRDLVLEWFERKAPLAARAALPQVDSKAIDEAYRKRLLDLVISRPEAAAVISHGTDTLVETADFLVAHGIGGKTAVLVGAMTPLSNGPESDGEANLKAAVAAASTAGPGVFIVLSDWTEDGDWAPRLYEHRVGAWVKLRDADGRRSRLARAPNR